MRKLTFVLVVCLLLAGISFAQYVQLIGPPTTIQFKNNGSNYGTRLGAAGSINFVGCTASGTAPNFTITCSPMVYPGAGIPVSTGSAWDTSISPSGAKCYPFQGSGGTGCDTPTGAGTVNSGTGDGEKWHGPGEHHGDHLAIGSACHGAMYFMSEHHSPEMSECQRLQLAHFCITEAAKHDRRVEGPVYMATAGDGDARFIAEPEVLHIVNRSKSITASIGELLRAPYPETDLIAR
jgi:hypothetical protein